MPNSKTLRLLVLLVRVIGNIFRTAKRRSKLSITRVLSIGLKIDVVKLVVEQPDIFK